MTEQPQASSLLPPFAVEQLQRAAATPITADDPYARLKAIEQATERVKRDYHWLFQKEHENGGGQ